MLSNDQLHNHRQKLTDFEERLLCAAVQGLLANPSRVERPEQIGYQALKVVRKITEELNRA